MATEILHLCKMSVKNIEPLWIRGHFTSPFKQFVRIVFAILAQHFIVIIIFNLKRGTIERKMFVFRLNCLYIQDLKYILFCCTLVSKCIQVDFTEI